MIHGLVQQLPGTPFTAVELPRVAAAAEHPSEHPLAAAIVRAARQQLLDLPLAVEFFTQPGRGVSALIEDRFIHVESPRALLIGDTTSQLSAAGAVDSLQLHGHTAVVVLCEHRPVGGLGITDQVRPEAVPA